MQLKKALWVWITGGGFEMMGPKEKRTTEEKQKLLGRHLNNVAELIRDLGENTTPAVAAG